MRSTDLLRAPMLRRSLAGLIAGFGVLLAPLAALAAIGTPTAVVFAGSAGSGNTVTRNFAGAETYLAGDTVFIQFRWVTGSGSIIGIDDSKLNTWTCAPQTQTGSPALTQTACWSKLTTTLVAGDFIRGTVNASSSAAKSLYMTSVSGVGAAEVVTGGVGNNTASVNVSGSINTGTLSKPSQIIFASVTANSNLTAALNGFMPLTNLPNLIDISYKIVSSTATQTPQYNTQAFSYWQMQVVSFPDAAPPSGANGSLMMLGVGQ